MRDRATQERASVAVRCVGTGDAFGSGGRFQSAYAVLRDRSPGVIMLDFGATTLTALHRHGIDLERIELVAISHLHGDHYGGLPYLLRQRQLTGCAGPLTILGPRGTTDRLSQGVDVFFPPCRQDQLLRMAQVRELEPGDPYDFGEGTVTVFPAVHRPETNPMTVRLTVSGVTIGYSGDSAWTEGIVEAADEADLFILEAYTHRPSAHHMSVPAIAAHLDALRARQILLTHMGPDVLAAPPSLPGCALARDGMLVSVPHRAETGPRPPTWPAGDPTDSSMGIGEFSERVGKSIHAIRYYEQCGLMPRVERVGNRRRFRAIHLEWLEFMERLKAAGMSLARIAEYATLLTDRDRTIAARLELLRTHREVLAARTSAYQGSLGEIDRKIRWLVDRGRATGQGEL